MELQAVLVLCGLGVAGAAVLLLMGLFSASGTSYEEAVAQQRKATTELLALTESKGKPKKNVKKANKKQAKKERSKDAAVATTASEPESEVPAESGQEDEAPSAKPHVEFCPPVVVDIPADTPPNIKIRKRGKDVKIKPILVNKEDPSCVSESSAPPSPAAAADVSNHFEQSHPKDEFELLHAAMVEKEKASEKKEDVADKKEAKGSKQGKAKHVPKPAEVAKEEPAKAPQSNAEPPKEQRKGKKSERKSDEVDAPRDEVVIPLNVPQPSELTTEKLLKQALAATAAAPPPAHTPPPKNKKKKQEMNVMAFIAEGGGVNVTELVRVVREAVLSRNEIQILTDALLNKQHDQLPMHSDWSEGPNDPMQKLKKQLAEKEKALADEIDASQALHNKLKELRGLVNAERGRAAASTRAAEEAGAELAASRAALQRALDEKHALAQEKLMLQQKLTAEGEAQNQRVQMEMHIQRLTEAEAALMAQLSALQAEAGARAHDAAQARCDAALAQQHAADLAHQLQEANRMCSELDAARAAAALAERSAREELQELYNANRRHAQVQAELISVREQLSQREAEVAEARQLAATAAADAKRPQHNGLPTEHKSVELAKVESIVSGLREELSAAQRDCRSYQEQITKLQEQLKQYQDKNNELRTKNWKVMEALQTAEKALQSRTKPMPAQDSLDEAISRVRSESYAEVASVLSAAWPAAAVGAAPGRSWVDAFADRLRQELAVAARPTPTGDEEDLRAQNQTLQALVDKYKRIIDDTEGVLSRLQQNVTAEEARWAAQLAAAQKELDELRQRTVTQMQNKIDSLEADLRQARANQNHSFADAERQTEERLMELSSKNKIETCNGPLQVGLEEK